MEKEMVEMVMGKIDEPVKAKIKEIIAHLSE